jgi:hypothetical protein
MREFRADTEDAEDRPQAVRLLGAAGTCDQKVYEEGDFGLLGISIPPP